MRTAIADSTGRCVRVALTRRKSVPPDTHPWREATRRAAQQKALPVTAASRPSLADTVFSSRNGLRFETCIVQLPVLSALRSER